MIFTTTYRAKPLITMAETAEMMAAIAEAGSAPGELAHYLAADGSHGVVISDTDDVALSHRNNQNHAQWIEFDSDVMLTLEQAAPNILDALAWNRPRRPDIDGPRFRSGVNRAPA